MFNINEVIASLTISEKSSDVLLSKFYIDMSFLSRTKLY